MRRIANAFRKLLLRGPRPVILMYHRIADMPYDPWGLAVTPERFADQLKALKSLRRPLSMDVLVDELEKGCLDRRAVALTFDDGYIDNLTSAKPLLEAARVPASVFLTTGRVGATEPFWWDDLAHMCLGGAEAVESEIEIAGRCLALKLPPQVPSPKSAWRWDSAPRTDREHVYLELWTSLQRLEDYVRAAALDSLRRCFGGSRFAPSGLPMRREDVTRLINGGLITIGSHGQTHRPLTAVAPAERQAEIELSRRDCEELTRGAVNGFAYPHGDRDGETMAMAREAGFKWAVSTCSAALDTTRYNVLDLPRMQVLNWTGSELIEAISVLEYGQ
jgi:peptidoglycan/xylan/chitin deacetylase (PgdA/CDA1 family)